MIENKSKVGRPTSYTTELAQEICETIACTSKGLKSLCKSHPHWPCPDTIYSWLMKHKEFSDLYARGKQSQVDCLVDEILEIADDGSQDVITDEAGKVIVNQEHIQRAKLKIDTRKWLAAKLCPRLYGNRVQCDSSNDFVRHEEALKMLQILEKIKINDV